MKSIVSHSPVRAFATGFLCLIAAAAPARAAPAAAFETPAREAILMDADTGAVLFEKEADAPMPPARR